MAGRPKDPTVNHKIYLEIDRLLNIKQLSAITIDEIADNTGISKATIYRRWSDKNAIIMSMFVDQLELIDPKHDYVFDDLYSFIIKVMSIYKTHLGRAVLEILISERQTDAKTLFLQQYFKINRQKIKEIISPYVAVEEQDMFIDLIFSPIYFNILIKPDVLDEQYIRKILAKVMTAFDMT